MATIISHPETHSEEMRRPVVLRSLAIDSAILLRDPVFIGLTLIGGFGLGGFMVFLANGAFVYSNVFGLGPTAFSLAFPANAPAVFAASQGAARLLFALGAGRLIGLETAGFALCILAPLGLERFLGLPLAGLILGLFLANTFLGLLLPVAMVLSLDAHGTRAGRAASMSGAVQMCAGSTMVAIAGSVFDGTTPPMLAAIALCAVLTAITARMTLPHLFLLHTKEAPSAP
ncbi:MAG: hypothetical protein AAFQ51_05590 [Pseudomonadota bacterium]